MNKINIDDIIIDNIIIDYPKNPKNPTNISNDVKKRILYVFYIIIFMIIFEILFFVVFIVSENNDIVNYSIQLLGNSLSPLNLNYNNDLFDFLNSRTDSINSYNNDSNITRIIILCLIVIILIMFCLPFKYLNLSKDLWFYVLLTILILTSFCGTLYIYGKKYKYTTNNEILYKNSETLKNFNKN